MLTTKPLLPTSAFYLTLALNLALSSSPASFSRCSSVWLRGAASCRGLQHRGRQRTEAAERQRSLKWKRGRHAERTGAGDIAQELLLKCGFKKIASEIKYVIVCFLWGGNDFVKTVHHYVQQMAHIAKCQEKTRNDCQTLIYFFPGKIQALWHLVQLQCQSCDDCYATCSEAVVLGKAC